MNDLKSYGKELSRSEASKLFGGTTYTCSVENTDGSRRYVVVNASSRGEAERQFIDGTQTFDVECYEQP